MRALVCQPGERKRKRCKPTPAQRDAQNAARRKGGHLYDQSKVDAQNAARREGESKFRKLSPTARLKDSQVSNDGSQDDEEDAPQLCLPCTPCPNANNLAMPANQCRHSECTKRPSFNLPTERHGRFCREHKLEGMVNVQSKRCEHEGCTYRPVFNLPTERRGRFCREHKLEGMVDVKNKRCEHEGCTSQPSFNLPTERRGRFCREHKLEGMVDVHSKRCEHEGCTSLNHSFNLPTERRGRFCREHKFEGMVDVQSKRCEHEGCLAHPCFNLPTERRGRFCGSHRIPGMVNVKKKSCADCKSPALFGLPGKRAQYCAEHKMEGMVNIVLESKCCVLDCEADYDVHLDGQKYCLRHCPEEQAAIVLKRLCKYCDIKERATHVCKDCRRVSCKKEWGIVRFLRKAIDTKFEYNSSRMLQGCSKKRPDVYFDLPTHCVIVEIDEHQHATYSDSCECARLNEIVNGIGGRPVVVIRFNPDTTRAAGQALPLALAEKLDLLVATIKEQLMTSSKTFSVLLIQLYFDDALASRSTYEPFKTEDITKAVCI